MEKQQVSKASWDRIFRASLNSGADVDWLLNKMESKYEVVSDSALIQANLKKAVDMGLIAAEDE